MAELINTNTFIFENYKTEFFIERNLKEFLLSESIPCLSSRFKNPEEFYNSIIFKIPNIKKHKNYKMIYFHLANSPKEYISKEEIAKKHSILTNSILAEGSVRLMDTSKQNPPIVRWLLIKN